MKSALFLLGSVVLMGSVNGVEKWPRFRGEDGRGVSEAKVATTLDGAALKWSAALPGNGSSSPVIWGEKLFVTGEDREKGVLSLVCVNALSGESEWTKDFQVGEYHLHQFNNTAAASPAVSEDLVVVSWYDGAKERVMLSAYDHTGKSVWSYEVGPQKTQHGVSLHPVIHGERVVIAHLHMNEGYVAAISTKDGKVQWKTAFPGGKTSYVAPLIRKVRRASGEGYEVIVAAQSIGVVGLDLADGKEQWAVPGTMKERTIVSPIDVLAGSGSGDSLIATGCKNGVYFTVRPPVLANGRMTEPEVVWKMKGKTPYVPTPVSDGSTVYALSDGGALVALDALGGEEKWKQNLKGNFYASPILAGGNLYCLSREGQMVVAAVGDHYREISRTSLEVGPECEWVDATPAVGHGNLYVRIGSRLDCFGSK
ncbi:MAG: PQQ-binding-like beta-propeller repeat protein [Verrucomicrobiaceae bacterium]